MPCADSKGRQLAQLRRLLGVHRFGMAYTGQHSLPPRPHAPKPPQALCFASTQLRSLSNVTELSFVSLVCVIVVLVLCLVVVGETHVENKQQAWLLGNPAMSPDADADDGRSSRAVQLDGWYTFALGVSTTAWAYVPSFLTVELANPRVMKGQGTHRLALETNLPPRPPVTPPTPRGLIVGRPRPPL